jgi:hypothetical protein
MLLVGRSFTSFGLIRWLTQDLLSESPDSRSIDVWILFISSATVRPQSEIDAFCSYEPNHLFSVCLPRHTSPNVRQARRFQISKTKVTYSGLQIYLLHSQSLSQ